MARTASVPETRVVDAQEIAPRGALAVKHGFIHFHSPATAVAQEHRAGMARSSSWPALPVADAEEPSNQWKLPDVPRSDGSGVADFVPSTPSTTCPSNWSAGSPFAHLRQVDARAPRVPVRRRRATERRAPFMSLMLPEWAMELAAKAPVEEDFDELSSWYSASPPSTPLTSPRAPLATGARARPRWADLIEEEDDAAPVWPTLRELSSGAWSRDLGEDDCASSWAWEDEAVWASAGDAETPRRKARWADLAEEEDALGVWSEKLCWSCGSGRWRCEPFGDGRSFECEDLGCVGGAWHADRPAQRYGLVSDGPPMAREPTWAAVCADDDFFVDVVFPTPEWPRGRL